MIFAAVVSADREAILRKPHNLASRRGRLLLALKKRNRPDFGPAGVISSG
jgi:hypothetical protein